MARTKPKNMINDRNEAEEVLQRIDEIDRQFADMDMKEAVAVAKVREQFTALRKENNHAELEGERKLLVRELEAWAEKNRKDWTGKTLVMRAGKIGFQWTPKAVTLIKKVSKNFNEAIDKIKLLLSEHEYDFIRTKEELDKETILAAHKGEEITDIELEAVGLKVSSKEEFWLESKASKDLEEAAKKLKAA